MNRKQLFGLKIVALFTALMLFSALAMAEIPDATEGEFGGFRRAMVGSMPFVDESTLDEAQLGAYQQAKAAYEAHEDRELGNLVAAGSITQEEVDEYLAQRGQPRQMPTDMPTERRTDRTGMTDEQREALGQAMQAEDREAALADLIAQGIISQGDVDAMSAMQRGFGEGNLWMRVQMRIETDTVAMIAVNNMGVAAEMMRQTLSDAGIEIAAGHSRRDEGEAMVP